MVGPSRLICLGAFAGAHGVRGLVKVKSFTEARKDIASYGPLVDEAGERAFTLDLRGQAKGVLLARVEGVADRNAAQALRGVRLHVDRAALPEPEDDAFYYTDLIGLPVYEVDGGDEPVGTVRRVGDHGAGDVIEVRCVGPDGRGRIEVLPFTREIFPVVDVTARKLEALWPDTVEIRDSEKDEGA